MGTNKLKIMLSFMREIDEGNIPNAKDYDISEKEFFNIIEVCKDEGFIKNVIDCTTLSDSYKKYLLDNVALTFKGIKYLDDNSTMMKTYKGLKEVRSWLPF